jgi:hypothetical protein
MLGQSKKPDKAEMAQKLADELERVSIAERKLREATDNLYLCQQQRDRALRDFQSAYSN